MIILCREVNKYRGGIDVYKLELDTVGTDALFICKMRSRLNPELRYYACLEENWEENEEEITDVILKEDELEEVVDFLDGDSSASMIEAYGIVRL